MRWLVFPFIFLLLIPLFSVPVTADDGNDTQILESVVAGGISKWVETTGSELYEDNPVYGNVTETNVFSPIVNPVKLDQQTFADMDAEKETCYKIGKVIIALITLFVLLQELKPGTAAEMVKFINGKATYYYPSDIFTYALKLGMWFACGFFVIILMILWNNDIVKGMDISVLNQVVVSSENMPNFITLGVGTKLLKYYFSVREIIIICAIKKWYFLGLILFWKRVRWVGILLLEYIAVQIFSQVILVFILTTAVAYVIGGGMEWYYDMTVYGGTSIFMLVIAFVAFTIPIWIKLFSPSTLRSIVGYARLI